MARDEAARARKKVICLSIVGYDDCGGGKVMR